MLANHGVVQRAILEGHLDQTATGLFHGLLNGHGHFAGLALAHADTAVAIAHHGQCSEAHGTTTLHHLADAVDANHLFAQAVVFLLCGVPTLCFSHLTIPCLEFQTGFTRGLGQRLDTAVITETRTVKSDLLDTGSLGLLGHALANQAGGGNIGPRSLLACQFLAHFGLQRGSAEEHTIAFRRNDACVNVRVRPVNRQAMYAQFGDFPASGDRTTQTGCFLVHNSSLPARLLLLGFFEDDAFVGITHTLALVGLRLAVCTNLRSHLTDDLLVCTLDDDFRLAGAFGLHTSRQLVNDVVGETELQLHRIALDLCAETHANEVQTALETLADTGDHVVHQGAGRPRHGLGLTRVVGNSKRKLVVFLTDDDIARQFLGQCAQRALDDDLPCADRCFNTLGQLDGVLGYTRHLVDLLRPRSTALRRRRLRRGPCDQS